MAEITCFAISDGYKVQKKEERVSLAEAGCLGTKKQRRYTSVRRDGEELVLEKHRVICPGCGCGTPAYSRFLRKGTYGRTPRVPRDEVLGWLEQQYSFFWEENARLELNAPVTLPEEFECPRCRCRSGPAREELRVTIVREGQRVLLRCTPVSMKRLLALMLEENRSPVSLRFPMEETVEFDIEKSRTVCRIADGTGTQILARELTGEGQDGLRPTVFSWLGRNRVLKRKFARAFSLAYGEALPFLAWELTPGAYLDMTRFSHFPREFYDAIPYNLQEDGIEESFRAAAGGLSDITCLPELYAASVLPGSKSVRRMFFTNPGFFFYIREAEALAEVFSDVNYFCRLLALGQIYDLFSCLHMYPGTLAFFRDYAVCRGQGMLLRELKERYGLLEGYARCYCALSPEGQAAERKKWRGEDLPLNPRQRYSLPVGRGAEGLPAEQTVNGYTFARLRNKRAFLEAAKALNNCLGEWDGSRNPVIAVKLEGSYVAAIEVEGQEVVQQLAIDNGSVRNDPTLFAAIEKWKALNQLTDGEMLSVFEDDEDEELPF